MNRTIGELRAWLAQFEKSAEMDDFVDESGTPIGKVVTQSGQRYYWHIADASKDTHMVVN